MKTSNISINNSTHYPNFLIENLGVRAILLERDKTLIYTQYMQKDNRL
ncbi:hypothetical protein M2451_002206 [Dysgonomonas sp. PFB1-18]|nr:hypothetical protein [Dysgonomonas sp. PF1-14]MDH6339379.1 hypothetical protein [Dysgonomonas sp. PF1-16]MDH6380878.1 hypothetical protein [Dysgonomonas sp. PFB1-18]MDH6397887.1 hypothetical protein [Dysgonomonas sp. PF1-23]